MRSPLVGLETLELQLNPVSTDAKYSRHNMASLPQLIQIHLS